MYRRSTLLFLGALTLGSVVAVAASPDTQSELKEPVEPVTERIRARAKVLRAQGVERPLQQAIEELMPLTSSTVGATPAAPSHEVVVPAEYSLSVEADMSLGGFVFKEGHPFLHNDGGYATGNTALGLDALISGAPAAYSNTALGQGALTSNRFGSRNTAVGYRALAANTSGYRNTAVGNQALYHSTGPYNTGIGNRALYSNENGDNNTAVGDSALSGVSSGFYNVAIGSRAVRFGNGILNVGVGFKALEAGGANGGGNVAIGGLAAEDTTSFGNVAVGDAALRFNTTGVANTAIGSGALVSVNSTATSGSYNTAIGDSAGDGIEYGSHNITIGTSGSYTEYYTIRLGDTDTHTQTYIAGVRGVTTGQMDAIPVMIDSNGQLGTVSSSRRLKNEISDLGKRSRALLDLRPVSFHFKNRQHSASPEFGLIAEEVESAFPELLVRDREGRPETVKYQALPVLLLNELQRQERELRFHRWALLVMALLPVGLFAWRR